MTDPKYAAFTALDPFFDIVQQGLAALVDGDHYFDTIAEVERAGGRLLRRGEFAPGLPYAYVADPDGYEIEIWFE